MTFLSSLSPRRRWWIYCTASIVVSLAIIFAIASPIITHVAKSKLQALVQKRMNATLVLGGCSYWPPYTLTFANARLTAHGQTLLSIDRLKVKFITAWGGLKGLRAADVDVAHPVLNLPSSNQGSSRLSDLFRKEPNESSSPASSTKPSPTIAMPSQIWRVNLRNLEIIQDTQDWKNLDIQAQVTTANTLKFSCHVTSDPDHALNVDVTGTFDPDKKIVAVRNGEVAIALNTLASADFLPADIRQKLLASHVQGTEHLLGSGLIPLQHPEQSTFTARFDLSKLHADNADWPAPLDDGLVSLELSRTELHQPIIIHVRDAHVISGPTTLRIRRANLTADPQRRTWAITKLEGGIESAQATTTATTRSATRWSSLASASQRYTVLGSVDFTAAANGAWPVIGEPWPHVTYKVLAYARDTSLLAPRMPAPIEHINGGPLLFTDDHAEIQNFSAHYGYDVLQITSARLKLSDPSTGLGAAAIDADMRFDRNSPGYPEPLGWFMYELHPQGSFHAGGRCLVYPAGHEPRGDYAFTVSSPDASFALGGDSFPIEHAKLTANADTSKTGNGEVHLSSFNGSVLGGTVSANGELKLQTPIAIAADATFIDVDVRQAYGIIAGKGGRASVKENSRISGKANGDVHVENTGTNWQTTTGGGTVEITGGQFGNIPVLTQLATSAHFSDADFTGSEAAAVFDVSQGTVRLSNVAMSAPAIGIQGDGYLKFNGLVHLHVVVAPLADWRQKLKSTGIPIIGDAAGAVQTLLNRATRTLFYEFNVTGNIHDPKIVPVPVPILTKGAGKLFSHMLGTKHKQNLLDLLGAKPTTNQ